MLGQYSSPLEANIPGLLESDLMEGRKNAVSVSVICTLFRLHVSPDRKSVV